MVKSSLTPYQSLGHMLAERALAHPDRLFTRFDPLSSDVDLTYGDAWNLACRWANLFESIGIPRGRPALLALPNGADFVGAFFGASLAGLVPAPSIPRRKMSAAAFLSFLSERAKRILAGVIVTTPDSEDYEQRDKIPIVTPSLLPKDKRECKPDVNGDYPGLLQFTSATGGRSKAVLLTHNALLFQASAIARILRIDPESDLALSWLPLFHDMGLLGFLLTPATAGMTVFLLRTEAFAARPSIWMNTISRERATVTSGSPSAYALAARSAHMTKRTIIDLSSLRIALMGAERIMPATLQAVHAALGPLGLSWSSILPAYGMAEVGLVATLTPLGRGPQWQSINAERVQQYGPSAPGIPNSHGVVGCGFPVDSTIVQIVDDAGPLPERLVGQIMLKSPSLMTGHVTGSKIDTSSLRDGWLMTGDLGYLDHGELFVTGRMGEMLNVGGAKYMPEEFEEAAMFVEGVRYGRVITVGYYNRETSTETVVLIVETASNDPEFRQNLAMAIRQELTRRSLPLGDVVFVPPKTIERTPNGKLPRARYRERLRGGEFHLV
jgi:fatty-acyl-CoA synthase